MSDPFRSNYISGVVTGKSVTETVQLAGVPENLKINSTSIVGAESRTFGFEPEKYGLGKPKRIVIRGKISHE